MTDELMTVVREILMHVGQERLVHDHVEIPGELLRRLMHASARTREVSSQAGVLLSDAIYAMSMGRVALGHGPGARELAVAVTHAETAELWLKKAAAEGAKESKVAPESEQA